MGGDTLQQFGIYKHLKINQKVFVFCFSYYYVSFTSYNTLWKDCCKRLMSQRLKAALSLLRMCRFLLLAFIMLEVTTQTAKKGRALDVLFSCEYYKL